jgi:hypothetical protein
VQYSAKINVFDAILAGYRAFFVKNTIFKEKDQVNPAHDDYFFWRCQKQAFRYCSKPGDIG